MMNDGDSRHADLRAYCATACGALAAVLILVWRLVA